MTPPSVLFYVQHLLGIGHLRRALLLVEALARAGAAVTLVSGGEPVAGLADAGARHLVQLPPLRARDGDFSALVDAAGRPLDAALQQARCGALLAAFAAAAPDAIVIEAFPFGRRAFSFELDPLIAAARAALPKPLILSSIRDILVARDDKRRNDAIVARIRADFDAVLVHGDPAFIPLDASFPAAAAIADRLVYTGYVAARDIAAATPARDADADVLVAVGGGAVGYALLSTALSARRRGCLAGRRWCLLTGPNLPEDRFAALARDLPEGVVVERYRPDYAALLGLAAVSVSQAGYNTVIDILAARVPAVLVPFAAAGETEQTLRAERLAAAGVVEHVAEAALSPESLTAAIMRAAARPPEAIAIDTGGAARSAAHILAMIAAASARHLVSPATDGMIRK